MSITVTAPPGVLAQDGERAVIPRLTEAVLHAGSGVARRVCAGAELIKSIAGHAVVDSVIRPRL